MIPAIKMEMNTVNAWLAASEKQVNDLNFFSGANMKLPNE